MRSILRSVLLSVLLSTQLQAAAIWHVEGDREFYLFGTIHLLKPDTFPLPDVYEQSLSQCDDLWLEVDTHELQDKARLQQARQLMQLPAGQRLENQLSKSAYSELQGLANVAGVSLQRLQHLKPWAAVNQLTLMIFQQTGFTGEGLDPYLHRQAERLGIRIHAFESLLWQLEMFDELSRVFGDEFVEFSAEDLENPDQLVAELYLSWQRGDYQSLYKQAAFDRYPQVEQALLTARNAQWMTTLLELDAGPDTHCVAVGLLHMAGEQGLIARFEAAGYRVTQITE